MYSQAKHDVCTHAAYEAVRGYLAIMGDEEWPAWDEAPAWRREGMAVIVKQAFLGGGPDHAHADWLNFMVTQGWKYDRVLDEKLKTHPGIRLAEAGLGPSEKIYQAAILVARAMGKVINVPML